MQNSLNLNISTCIAAPKSCQKTSKQEWFAIRCLEKIRYDKEAMPKTNPFNHGQWTCFEYFFSVLCICIRPVFALIAFEFEVLFILLQALEFTIGSYRVIFRFLSNLFPYTLFCVFLITVFTIFELFCVALIKFLR